MESKLSNLLAKWDAKLLAQLALLKTKYEDYKFTFQEIGQKIVKDHPEYPIESYFENYFPSKNELLEEFEKTRRRSKFVMEKEKIEEWVNQVEKVNQQYEYVGDTIEEEEYWEDDLSEFKKVGAKFDGNGSKTEQNSPDSNHSRNFGAPKEIFKNYASSTTSNVPEVFKDSQTIDSGKYKSLFGSFKSKRSIESAPKSETSVATSYLDYKLQSFKNPPKSIEFKESASKLTTITEISECNSKFDGLKNSFNNDDDCFTIGIANFPDKLEIHINKSNLEKICEEPEP